MDYGYSPELKFVLQLICGIPKAAVEQNLPSKTQTITLSMWPTRNAPVPETIRTTGWIPANPGRQVAEWGFDFVKVDDLPTINDYSLQQLTNKEILDCNQNGECG